MAFYYGTRLDAAGRRRLFGSINAGPTLYEAIMLGLPPATAAAQNGFDLRTRPGAQAVSPLQAVPLTLIRTLRRCVCCQDAPSCVSVLRRPTGRCAKRVMEIEAVHQTTALCSLAKIRPVHCSDNRAIMQPLEHSCRASGCKITCRQPWP